MSRMSDFQQEVVGLANTETTGLPHHVVVLERGEGNMV